MARAKQTRRPLVVVCLHPPPILKSLRIKPCGKHSVSLTPPLRLTNSIPGVPHFASPFCSKTPTTRQNMSIKTMVIRPISAVLFFSFGFAALTAYAGDTGVVIGKNADGSDIAGCVRAITPVDFQKKNTATGTSPVLLTATGTAPLVISGIASISGDQVIVRPMLVAQNDGSAFSGKISNLSFPAAAGSKLSTDSGCAQPASAQGTSGH